MYYDEAKFEDLIGKIIERIDRNGNESLTFHCQSGEVYKMYHSQSCCENVEIAEIHGDLSDICGLPIQSAVESITVGNGEASETHTFYHIRTHERSISIRWYGSSNGYYSETVSFVLMEKKKTLTEWIRLHDWNWDECEYGTELDLLLANQDVVYHRYSRGDDDEIDAIGAIDVLAVRLHKEE